MLSKKLSEYSLGRDNNFNLVRVVAALAVLASHSFPLVAGRGTPEPLESALGSSLGSFAVDVFFITSGFLVTSSLLTRRNVIQYALARALRIFPALIVMLSLTVFALGPFFTSLPLSRYWSSKQTYSYLARNSVLFLGVQYPLPGVFVHNPYVGAVNGSLWTLPFEIRMYGLLALVWATCRLLVNRQSRALSVVLIAFAVAGGAYFLVHEVLLSNPKPIQRLFFMFFLGAGFYACKERITLSRWIFWSALGFLAFSMVCFGLFWFTYSLSIGYLTLYAAYVPAGVLRTYNRLGDYSYGIYIYAFPVQQSLAAFMPGISLVKMMATSAGITIFLAVLSWHALEKRALRLKDSRAANALLRKTRFLT